jgi:hypothetical protein
MTEELKQKGSFISESQQSEKPRTEVVPPEVSLMLIYGKLCSILEELKTLNGVFVKVKQEPVTATSMTTAPTSTPKPVSNRILEIRKALDQFKDILLIDEDSSTLSVIVRPKQFLGAENFAKIASTIRAIGGQYVSAGKNSHFEISKAESKKP